MTMKTKIPLLVSMMLLLFLAVACTEEELLIESSETTPLRSRAEVGYNNESLTNKNLFDDWENVTRIELNSTSGAIDTNSVTAPWVDGTSTALSESFCKDIKKADGWVMLFHTFKEKGLDNFKNYICLYNKFTGVIKVFYYNELGEFGSTLTYWNLNSTKPLRLLDTPSRFTKPNDAAPSNNSLSFTNEVNTSDKDESINNHGLIKAWNGFTYQVPCYFKEEYDCDITISALNKFVTSFEFSGQTENKITGTITSITTADKIVAKGTARQGEISRYGKEALGFMNYLNERANRDDNRDNGITLNIANDIKNLLSGITENKYPEAFKDGVNQLFNRSTISTYRTTSEVRLESQGHLLIKASELTTTTPVYNVRFNLKDVINGTVPSGSGLVLSSDGIGLENLGTWTIKSLPTIYYERISPVYPLSYTVTHNEWDRVEVTGNIVMPPYHYTTPELIINKDLQQYVTYSNLTMKLVGCIKADNQYYGSWYEISPETNYVSNEAFSNDIYSGIGTPTLYDDSINHTYSIPKELYVKRTIRTPFTSTQINDKVRNMYYDWGTILRGRMIAMVTAEIHYNYNGKTIKTIETRSYPIKYGYSDATKPEDYHNPPYDIVINYQNPLRRDLEYYFGNNPSLVP